METRRSLQQMVLGNLDSNMQKNESGPLSYTTHKNKFKMDERPKCEMGIHQNPRGEHRQQPLQSQPQQLLATHVSKGKGNKSKNELLGLHQDKKASAQPRKQSKKLRGSPWNGKRYLQVMLQVKDWYPRSTKNISNSIREKQINKS